MLPIDRREFLSKGSSATLSALFASHLMAEAFSSPLSSTHLINRISLQTSADIGEMIHFYHDLIGLEVIDSSSTSCSFKAGASVLHFSKTEDGKEPFYHFAFNIPENKIKQAEAWQAGKSSLIEPHQHLKDFGSDYIVNFSHWNAHSVFFYDPAGNVVEYIARHTLSNSAKGNFSTKDILYISEIGLVVSDVYKAYKIMSPALGINQYSSASDKFLAMGDELGLVLLFGENTKAAFNKGRNRNAYKTEIQFNKSTGKQLDVLGYPFQINH